MANTKKRRINFFSFITKQKENAEDIRPAHMLRDVLNYIDKLDIPLRKHDCSSSKFCYLEHIEESEEKENINGILVTYHIHKLYFTSAKHSYSAPLIDRATVKKRKNPKMLTEGEAQKTHLVIKHTADDVLVCFENNGSGISIQQVEGYFKKYTKQYYADIIGHKPDFFLTYNTLAKDNFLEEVKALDRVLTARVNVSKSILGSDALGYSDRTSSAQHDIILEVKAERNKSILPAVMDIYAKFSGGGSKIKKIRIEGKSSSKHNVVIDTRFIEKVDHLEAQLNSLTGEVETTNIFSNLYALAKTIS